MATLTIFGETSNGRITSNNTVWATASAGSNLNSLTGGGEVGGYKDVGTFWISQSFIQFDTSALPAVITSATLSVFGTADVSATEFTVEARLQDWGTTLTTADWVAGTSLASCPLLATFDTTPGFTTSAYNTFTNVAMLANLNLSGFTRMIIASDHQRLGIADGGGALQAEIYFAPASGSASQDPKLVITGTTTSGDLILNPYGDLLNNQWTTGTGATANLFLAIDENTISDTDYIQSPVGPLNIQYYETALESHFDPVSSSGHIVHYRYQKNVAGGAIDLGVELWQGDGFSVLSADQAGFESGIADWVALSQCTIARSSTTPYEGSGSLNLTSTGTGAITARTGTGVSGFPVLPNTGYRFSGRARLVSGIGRSQTLKVTWYTSGGTLISTSGGYSNANSGTVGLWELIQESMVYSPATAAFASIEASVSLVLSSGHVFGFDSLILKGPVALWNQTNISNAWTTQNQTLTSPQADSITDYSDLRLHFAPSMTSPDIFPAYVADRATANSNSTVTTVDLVLTGLTVGNTLIIRSAADNSGLSGAARSLTPSNQSGTIIGGTGGSDYYNYQVNEDPGAASAGTTLNVVFIRIYATSGTVRLTYSGAVVQACVAEEWSGVDLASPVYDFQSATQASSTNLASAAAQTIAYGYGLYGVAAIEGPSSDTYTDDTDTVNGSWVTLTKLGTSNGTADLNQTTYASYKTVTATGSQTYNATVNNARDSAGATFILRKANDTIKAQVSWANLELPVSAGPHDLGINAGLSLPTFGAVNVGAGGT